VVWKQKLTLAPLLTRSNSYIDPSTKLRLTSLDAWTERDHQAAAAILFIIFESILSAHIDLLSDSNTALPRARVFYDSLVNGVWQFGPTVLVCTRSDVH
jgi:hypothetical protein